MKLLFTLVALFASGQTVFAQTWNGWNNPFKLGQLQTNMERLPLAGSLEGEGLGWPGYYWANNKGGIAQRWRSEDPQHFSYRSPDLESLLAISPEEVDKLSPAEKYDIYMGRYDFPTVRSVWGQTRSGHKDWYGICHGAAPSALNHPEPGESAVVNPDGIRLTFYSSDVKALLSYFYAKEAKSRMIQIGKRCFVGPRTPIFSRSSGCVDVHPAAFHLIVANKLGLEKAGFIADIARYSQVWNHAAVKYHSKVLEESAPVRSSARATERRLMVDTTVFYTGNVLPEDQPILPVGPDKLYERRYRYWLDLNSSGDIIGGAWIWDERPDFIWTQEKASFDGYWRGLNDIYRAANAL